MQIQENQVHIWKLDLDKENLDTGQLYTDILSEDEKKRANRLKSGADRERSIISRGTLRIRLSSYLGISPQEINFSYNKFGKPFLNNEVEDGDVKFNVSHSNRMLIQAITLTNEIGIDVEFVKDINKADKIIERFFSADECRFYNSQPEDKKRWAFFSLWTRKEAYSKARGRGIGLPAKDFDLNLIPDCGFEQENKDQSIWKLHEINMQPGYLAALATEGENIEICHFDNHSKN